MRDSAVAVKPPALTGVGASSARGGKGGVATATPLNFEQGMPEGPSAEADYARGAPASQRREARSRAASKLYQRNLCLLEDRVERATDNGVATRPLALWIPPAAGKTFAVGVAGGGAAI